ncbi:MAG: hypothetical protein QJR03_14985 [Sphaerobacter sp.]|nr:hypothetical protein [Sphaerobacter sp.]
MGYLNPEITLEFPELGDGIRVTITNPKLLPWGKKRALFDGLSSVNPDPAKINEIVAALVRSWTVPSLEDGTTLPTPAQDPSVVDRVPSTVVERIMEEFARSSGVDPNSVRS